MLPDTLFSKSKPRTITVGFRTDPDDFEILRKAACDRGFATIAEFLRDAARNSLTKNIAAL